MTVEVFGQMPDGAPVHRVSLRGGGLSARVLSYGAVLQDLRLDGHEAPLILGFERFAPYLTHSPYFGATAGRCANRIRDGHLELDGTSYQLDRNFLGKHMLHGGRQGTGKRLWVLEDAQPDAVILSIRCADGEMGFPGNLTATMRLTLPGDGILDIVYTAETDAPTLCNLAHHSYFNLDGGATVQDHLLQIDAEAWLPVDGELIPTGERRAIRGSALDFSSPRRIGEARIPVDHNFCLSDARVPLRPVATLSSQVSAVTMQIATTEPGLQVYDGAKLDLPLPGLGGRKMGAHAGVALEPQVWPDANHHPDFPQAVLRPGETYRQHSQFRFSRAG